MTIRYSGTQICTVASDYGLLRELICKTALKLRIAANLTILLSPLPYAISPSIYLNKYMYCDPLKWEDCHSSDVHPHETRSIQLFIKSIRNTTISVHIDSTSSISDLKHLIYAHDGIPPCDQRLMHRGRELRDAALLSGLDVDGATITCLLRVLGGKPYHRIPLRVIGGTSRTHRIPLYWWFGFSRSYEDGRAGK